MNKIKPFDIFISYSNHDVELVEFLANSLSNIGLHVAFDRWILTPGESWQITIDNVIENSTACIFCIGAEGFTTFQNLEFEKCLEYGKIIVPVLLHGSKNNGIPLQIRNYQLIDFREQTQQKKELNKLIFLISQTKKTNIDQEEQLGDDLFVIGDTLGALKRYTNALEKAKSQKNVVSQTRLITRLGTLKKEVGDIDSAKQLFEESINLNKNATQSIDLAAAYVELANINLTTNDVNQAFQLFQKGIEVFRAFDDQNGEISILFQMARICSDRGDNKTAKKYYEQLLSLSKLTNDQNARASALFQIGSIMISSNNFVQARNYYKKALEINSIIGNRQGQAATLFQLAWVEFNEKNMAKALSYYDNSLQIQLNLGDKQGEAITRAMIGRVHIYCNNYSIAKNELLTSKKLFEDLDSTTDITNVDNLLKYLRSRPGLELIENNKNNNNDYLENSKYVIKRSTDQKYYINLIAANNEKILTSKCYNKKAGALDGIESIVKNSPIDERYDRKVAANGQPYFVLKAANHEVMGTSERYSSKQAMEDGIAVVKRIGPTAGTKDLS